MSPDATVLYENIFDDKGLPLEGRIWDLATRQPIGPTLVATDHGAFLPAGDRLLTNTNGAVVVRDNAGGRVWGAEIRSGSGITSIDPHPDGRILLIVGVDQTARLWEISPEAVSLPDRRGSGPEVPTKALSSSDRSRKEPRSRSPWSALRPDGRVALSWSAGPGGRAMIQARNPATGEPIGAPARHRPWKIRVLAFSPDGRSFATGSDPAQPGGLVAGEIRLWDTDTGRFLVPPMEHTNYVSALAFRPDGQVLAAGDFHGLVRFWDPTTGKEIGQPLPQAEIVLNLAYSRDGKTLAVAMAKDRTRRPGVRLWDVANGRAIGEVLPHRSNVLRLEFRPDGLALAAADEMLTTRLWDTTGGGAIGEPMFEETAAVFRPDGTVFATAGKDGTVRLRDAANGALIRSFRTNPSPARCVAFRGDGDLVAVGFEDGSVRLWDPAASRTIGPPQTVPRAVLAVTFTPDGRWVVALDECVAARTWPVPEDLEGSDLDEGTLRVEARTGLRMGPDLSVMRLDAAAWQERIAQADRLDGTQDRPAGDPAWHLGMARDAAEQGNAYAEIWHLDRLIADRPDDWTLYDDRAGVYDKLGRKVDREGDIARAIDLGADAARVLPRAEQLARTGRWEQAATLVAGCGRLGPLDAELAQAWVLTCLNAGDRAGYREACSAVMTRTGPRPTVVWDELAAAALVALSDAGLDDYAVPIGWLETRLSRAPLPGSLMRYYFSSALGGLLLRAGRAETAIARLNEGLAASKEPNLPGWCLLAIAYARQGDDAAAHQCFDRVRAWRPSGNPSDFWDDMTIDLLRREAETVILGDSVFPTNPFAPSESLP
jgi:WD40 repeat protein/Flp pilus assembly protein TadD